jgi:hypothetical protein
LHLASHGNGSPGAELQAVDRDFSLVCPDRGASGVVRSPAIFHALQYLVFPLRVEVNQYSTTRDVTETRAILHGIAYYLVLVIVGLVVFESPSISQVWGDKNFALQALIASAVNIHHYMIDGVIWKLRNPEVRKTLFAHLTPS